MSSSAEKGNAAAENGHPSSLEEQESEIYDRQMRLWGEEAQKRMSKSSVLFAGFGGLAAETAKNLVLAGLHAILQDSKVVTGGDVGSNFFVTAEDAGSNRAAASAPRVQELNPMVSVRAEARPTTELDEAFFKGFSCIILCGSSLSEQRRVAAIAQKNGVPLFVGDTFGLEGCFMSFLGKHTFRRERGTTLMEPETEVWPSMEEMEATKWGALRNRWGPVSVTFVRMQLILEFRELHGGRDPTASADDVADMTKLAKAALQRNDMPADFLSASDIAALSAQACANISPVCAIVGGMLGQEVLKVVSQRGAPSKNVFVLTNDCEGKVFCAPPHSNK